MAIPGNGEMDYQKEIAGGQGNKMTGNDSLIEENSKSVGAAKPASDNGNSTPLGQKVVG